MRTALVIGLLLLALPLAAQTTVSGDQSGTWTAAGSPYLVTGDVIVPAGQTLAIEPGVRVECQGFYRLRVNGTLLAEGTAEAPIVFTATDTIAGWHGIRLRNAQGTSRLVWCVIEHGRSVDGDYPDNIGGGVLNYGANLVIDHCVFRENRSVLHGGGLYVINSEATDVTDTEFTGNHCYMWGGAVCVANSFVTFTRCRVVDNTAQYNGAGFYFDQVYEPWLERCLIARNRNAVSSGAGIDASMSTPILSNCTITENVTESPYARGPAIYLDYSEVILANCIVWNNGGTGDEVHPDVGGSVKAFDTDMPVPGWGFTGERVITTDPLFTDPAGGDWTLTADSPCVDAGIAFLQVEDYYGETQTVVDLSPDEYDGDAPDMGYAERWTSTDADDLPGPADPGLHLAAYPSPFNPATTIALSLPAAGSVRLTVHDVTGRLVRRLVEGDHAGGRLAVRWDGRDDAGRALPSGPYLVRARAAGRTAVTRVMLVR